MNTSSISVAEGYARRQARRGLAVFLAFVVLFSVIIDAIIIVTGGSLWLICAQMWSVALSTVIARLVLREGFADVSFRSGGRKTWKYIVLAPIIPTIIGLVAWGIAWTTGLARFDPRSFGLIAPFVGDTASPVTIFLATLVMTAIIGTVVGVTSAAGEEIGWRGYMLTRLIDAGVP